MNHLEAVTYASQMMHMTNQTHKTAPFRNIHYNAIEETVTFDIDPHDLKYVTYITELLNLTFGITPGDAIRKTVYYII